MPRAMKTLKKPIFQNTGEQLTLFQEDSHASHTVLQDCKKAPKMNAIYGPKCVEEFEKFNHLGSWAKTFTGLLVGMEGWSSRRCKLIWKLKGTKYNRIYFQLQVLGRRTKETGSGLLPTVQAQGLKECENRRSVQIDLDLLPTPRAADVEGGRVKDVQHKDGKFFRENQKGERWGVKLRDVAESGMLPTPQARDWKYPDKPGSANLERKLQKGWTIDLNSYVGMFSTPTSNDAKNATLPESQKKRNGLPGALMRADSSSETGRTSQLNPRFVMEMMSFPPGWTELPFLIGETNPLKPVGTQ